MSSTSLSAAKMEQHALIHFYYASISSLSIGAPFWDVFSIPVALSLSLLQYYNARTTLPWKKWRGGRNEHNKLRTRTHLIVSFGEVEKKSLNMSPARKSLLPPEMGKLPTLSYQPNLTFWYL